MSVQVPVIERDSLEKVTIEAGDIQPAPQLDGFVREELPVADSGASVGVALADLQRESQRRAMYVKQIQQFVADGGGNPAGKRLDPNEL